MPGQSTTNLSSHRLSHTAQTVLAQRYRLAPKQKALIIFDNEKREIGSAIGQAALQLGARVELFSLPPERFSPEVLRDLTDKIQSGGYDLFINAIESRQDENPSRVTLVKSQMKTSAGIMHCPGIEESMLQIQFDFGKMVENAQKLHEAFKGAAVVQVRTALGTELKLSIEGRGFHDDVIPQDMSRGNFPFGEIYCAPIEESANGVLIADGSAGGFGLLPQPLRFDIEKGKILGLSWLNTPGADAGLLKRIVEAVSQDEGASVIGELGIGLAPYPICGNLLQDEKVAGTIHIAFGNNDFFGGRNKSRSHIDFLVRDPEFSVSYANNPGSRILMRDGNLIE